MKGVRVDKFKFYDLVIYAARGSSGARRLATALGSRRWRDDLPERYTRRRPYFRGNDSPMVVNWGSTIHPKWLDDHRFRLKPIYVNQAGPVRKAIDKLAFFQHLSGVDGVPLLKWTDQREAAARWLEKGRGVVCRTKLDASSGQGIVLAKTVDELIDAPLYTRYYPKTHEFRVHVFNGEVIDLTQKKLKGGADARLNSDTFVRSHDNGWVHAHGALDLRGVDQERLGRAAISSVSGLGLIFGAVDVLAVLDPPSMEDRSRSLKSFKICEINTGPGLENQATIEAYTRAILALKSSLKDDKAILEYKSEKNNDGIEHSLEGISGNQPQSGVPI